MNFLNCMTSHATMSNITMDLLLVKSNAMIPKGGAGLDGV
jgi:hypothetical protein